MNSFGYCYNSSIYCGNCVKEKEDKLRYLIRSMGGSGLAYWLSNLAFDFIVYNIFQIIFYLIIYVTGIPAIIDNFPNFILLFTCFGFSLVSLAHFVSGMFDKAKTAYKWYSNLILFGFIFVPVAIYSWAAQSRFIIIGQIVVVLLFLLDPFIILMLGALYIYDLQNQPSFTWFNNVPKILKL